MKSNIYIPKRITVGYQSRSDTYTKKLAYIIYTDDKGVLRKEKSWDSWRNGNLGRNDFENNPTEGFVLNKPVGGCKSDWNYRQSYCRVYDPRGFEFEIGLENLLYILENANSIKGKGLEGKFIYGWNKTDLVLIPENAPEYKAMLEFTELQGIKFSKKDLVAGWKYLTKKNEVVTYLGYYEEFTKWYEPADVQSSKGKKHWFYKKGFFTCPSCNHLVKKVEQDTDFPFLMDKLEKESRFSPVESCSFVLSSEKEITDLLNGGFSVSLYLETTVGVVVKTLLPYHITSDSIRVALDGLLSKSDLYYKSFSDILSGGREHFIYRTEKQLLNYYLLKTKLKNGYESYRH